MPSPMQGIRDLTGGDWAFLVKAVGGAENVARLKRGELEITLKAIKRILHCTTRFDPVSFIGEGWAPWRGPADGKGMEGDIDQDDRTTALTEINWANVMFKHNLKDGEITITGEENLKRQKEAGHVRFGGNVFLSLYLDYEDNKKNSVLEWLYRAHKFTFVDFFGLILRNPGGGRCVLCLYRYDDEWYWGHRLLDDDWDAESCFWRF